MNKKNLCWLVIAALATSALWFWSWCQPEKQVRRAQARFLSAVESRDYDAMAAMLADDYRDRWQHDKTIVISRCREVLSQFGLLTIEGEDHGLVPGDDVWILSDKIRIKGIGAPLAIYARDRVNSLKSPFAMSWRKRGWKPWDWALIEVAHAELELE